MPVSCLFYFDKIIKTSATQNYRWKIIQLLLFLFIGVKKYRVLIHALNNKLLTFDYILKLENFNNAVFSQLTGHSLRRENKTSGNTLDYHSFLTVESLGILNHYYSNDMLEYGYKQL